MSEISNINYVSTVLMATEGKTKPDKKPRNCQIDRRDDDCDVTLFELQAAV